MFQVKPIGKIRSALQSIDDCPLQEHEHAPTAIIELNAQFTDAARDLRDGDKIIILTWLNLADRSILTTHPRNDISNPLTGVFSTRSPHRPNPIGIHITQVIKVISPTSFEVSGLEVLDQTPLLDIKSA